MLLHSWNMCLQITHYTVKLSHIYIHSSIRISDSIQIFPAGHFLVHPGKIFQVHAGSFPVHYGILSTGSWFRRWSGWWWWLRTGWWCRLRRHGDENPAIRGIGRRGPRRTRSRL